MYSRVAIISGLRRRQVRRAPMGASGYPDSDWDLQPVFTPETHSHWLAKRPASQWHPTPLTGPVKELKERKKSPSTGRR